MITCQSCERPPDDAGVTTEEGAAKGRRLPSELLPVPLAHLRRPGFQPFQLSSSLQPAGPLTGLAAHHLSTASAATPLAGQGGVAMASGRQSEVSMKLKGPTGSGSRLMPVGWLHYQAWPSSGIHICPEAERRLLWQAAAASRCNYPQHGGSAAPQAGAAAGSHELRCIALHRTRAAAGHQGCLPGAAAPAPTTIEAGKQLGIAAVPCS